MDWDGTPKRIKLPVSFRNTAPEAYRITESFS